MDNKVIIQDVTLAATINSYLKKDNVHNFTFTEDELKKYLPKYLSEENYKTLLAELKSFPYNIDGRMYTSMLDKNVIFQGDGLKKMPIIDLVNIERGVKNVSCLILSNTCDMDLSNSRMFPASIMYAPIINLTTYISVLQKQGVNSSKIENHISDLKQQKITQIIFLPANSQMEDSIVFLDKIYHVDNRFINRDTLEDQRLFSLSDYGFYMLIFKLSIHFSRIQEKVNRGCIAN